MFSNSEPRLREVEGGLVSAWTYKFSCAFWWTKTKPQPRVYFSDSESDSESSSHDSEPENEEIIFPRRRKKPQKTESNKQTKFLKILGYFKLHF